MPISPHNSGYLGAPAKFEPRRGRLAIPGDVLASVDWKLTGTGMLVVEIVSSGHLRLHTETSGSELMTSELADLEMQDVEKEELETLRQVTVDRFHEGRYSAKDRNRLTMTQAVVMAFIGPNSPTGSLRVFVQARKTAIDVMTNEVRLRRLEQAR